MAGRHSASRRLLPSSSHSTRRGWPWVIGLIIVVMVICGGAVLLINAWVGRELDKAIAQPRPNASTGLRTSAKLL